MLKLGDKVVIKKEAEGIYGGRHGDIVEVNIDVDEVTEEQWASYAVKLTSGETIRFYEDKDLVVLK